MSAASRLWALVLYMTTSKFKLNTGNNYNQVMTMAQMVSSHSDEPSRALRNNWLPSKGDTSQVPSHNYTNKHMTLIPSLQA